MAIRRILRHTLYAAAGGAVVFAALSLGLAGPEKGDYDADPVSSVIFPPQSIPLYFDHALHLTDEVGAACNDCHWKAEESTSSLDNLLPEEDDCTACHDIDRSVPEPEIAADDPPGACTACHPAYDPNLKVVERIVIPRPNLKFNHQRHVDELEIACVTCHGDLAAEGVKVATRAQLPKMKLCLQCHDGDQAPDACTTCHLAEAGGFVDTEYDSGTLAPSGALRGATHTLDFRTQHKGVAQSDPDYCGNCHRKEFCTECHNGVIKPMDFHGNDYITLHPIDARRNTPDCSACHRLQTFCTGCHARSGVSSDVRIAGGFDQQVDRYMPNSQGAFHPPGWADLVRGKNHHAWQAQRNIRQCVSCHREEFCTRCHKAYELQDESPVMRFNPHPRNWAGSRRCESLRKRAGRMCLRCHIDVASVTCDR